MLGIFKLMNYILCLLIIHVYIIKNWKKKFIIFTKKILKYLKSLGFILTFKLFKCIHIYIILGFTKSNSKSPTMYLKSIASLVPLRFLIISRPILGRWNSVLTRTQPSSTGKETHNISIASNSASTSASESEKEPWEIYVDMANYDNCCCSSSAFIKSNTKNWIGKWSYLYQDKINQEYLIYIDL